MISAKHARLPGDDGLPDGTTPLMRELARLSAQQKSETSGNSGLTFGECVAAALRAPALGFASLPALLPVCDRVAIDGDEEEETSTETGAQRPPTTFRELHHFLTTGFDLAHFGVQVARPPPAPSLPSRPCLFAVDCTDSPCPVCDSSNEPQAHEPLLCAGDFLVLP